MSLNCKNGSLTVFVINKGCHMFETNLTCFGASDSCNLLKVRAVTVALKNLKKNLAKKVSFKASGSGLKSSL